MTSTVPAGSLSCVYSDVYCPRSKSLGCLSYSHYSEIIKPKPISLPCTCVICTEYVCVTTDLFTNLYNVEPFLCMVQAVEAAPPPPPVRWYARGLRVRSSTLLICTLYTILILHVLLRSLTREECLIHSAHLYAVMSHTACTSAHMSSLSPSSTLAGVLGLLLLKVAEGEMLYVSS